VFLTSRILTLQVCFATLLLGTSNVIAQDARTPDQLITAHIERTLYRSPGGEFHRVDVSSDERAVTLSGSVSNLPARYHAEELVSSIRGIDNVSNQIVVNSVVRPDKTIANDVQAAIYADPATDAYDTRITVIKGVVMLTGTAKTNQEKDLVQDLASNVVGVRRIQNNVVVTYRDETSDEKIVADIIVRLEASNWFEETPIMAHARKGAVKLSGRVANAAERKLAYQLAWVTGTQSVDVMNLKVVAEQEQLRKRIDKVSDQEVADGVRSAMFYNARVKSENVGVSVLNGLVTLTGVVDSFSAKKSAGIDANNVRGAWGVENALRVRQQSDVSDEDIESSIRAALARAPEVDRREVSVRVTNGHAHLYGEVDSELERQRAEQAASGTRGLVHVANHLTISTSGSTTSDWEIQKAIESELYWSPYVNRGEVAVSVEDGVATLKGKVDTWAERKVAAKNAIDGGAIRVKNRLSVEFGPSLTDTLR